ncbi:MAG: hypothetical protein OEY89_00050 [Gammaproteobacteria bacterium]|nr:hypothetical protein [Gammaproteobacteria bacterium]
MLNRLNLSLIMLVILSPGLRAAEFNYNVQAIMAYYENINRVVVPVDSEMSESVRGGINITENSAVIDAAIEASYEILNYENNQVDDQSVGYLNSNVLWKISPRQFEWFISDVFTQTTIDTLASDTPSNRQDANAISTGPNYIIRFNNRHSISFEIRYSDFYYEIVDYDNNRLRGAIILDYSMNSSTALSANMYSQSVYFDNAVLNPDYTRNDYFVGMNYRKGLNTIELELGSTFIEFENQTKFDDLRYSFLMNNQRTSNASLQLHFARHLHDTSSSLLELTSNGINQNNIGSSTSDIFTNDEALITYNREFRRGDFALSLFSIATDYHQQNNLDQCEKGFSFLRTIDMPRGSQLSFEARYSETQFDNLSPVRIDDNYIYRAGFSYAAGRNTRLNIEIESDENESSAIANNYEDLSVMLSLVYSSS